MDDDEYEGRFDERDEDEMADEDVEDAEQDVMVEPAFAKEGYLSKQGNFNSQWQRRWFCFRDHMLKYYKTMGDSKERGHIPIDSLHVTEVPEDKYNRTLCFELSSPIINRVFVLRAETQGELQDWMRAINNATNAVANLKQRRRSTAASAAQTRRVQDLRSRLVMTDSLRVAAGVGLKASQWRRDGALAGLSADQTNEGLRLDVLPTTDRLDFTACAAVHNALPAIAVASNQGRASVVQILRLSDPKDSVISPAATAQSAQQPRSRRMASILMSAIRGDSADKTTALADAASHLKPATSSSAPAMRVVQRFRLSPSSSDSQSFGCTSLSWFDDKLLVGSAAGVVQFYKCPFGHSTSSGGGGLADHNLEQTYEHPQTQSLHPPNTYVYSSRIQRVALNPVSKAAFLSLENNTAHLWALEQHTRPLHSERASSGALFAACWNPHSGTEFALGGQRRHLKVFDVRLLGHSQQSPVVFKSEHAHTDTLRDVAWSPLVPHWVATAGDDACVKVFDLRFGARPMMTMQCTNSIHSVSWSPSHAELLVAGGLDRKLRLFSMRSAGPHHLIDTVESSPAFGFGLGHGLVSATFVNQAQYVGVSGAGEVALVTMEDEFMDLMSQHRFGDDVKQKPKEQEKDDVDVGHQIESLLYRRDMAAAYSLIADATSQHWQSGQTEQVAQLLKLASSGLFAAAVAAGGADLSAKGFAKMVKDVAYFFPPKCVKASEPSPDVAQEIQLFKLRIALVKLLDGDKYHDILSLEDEILAHVERVGNSENNESEAFSVPTLLRVIQCILPHDYLRAVNLAYRLAMLFDKQNRFSDFVPITHLLFYPTIYHDTVTPNAATALIADSAVETDSNVDDKKVAEDVDRATKAQRLLERDLRNPKLILPQLNLVFEAFDCAHQQMPAAATELVELLESNRKLLPQSLHRLFLNALLSARLYDKFFIYACQLAAQLEGYRFGAQVKALMDGVGMTRLRKFLDECCVGPDRATPWDVSRPSAAAFTLLNIATNCPQTPSELRQCAPDYLKKCSALLRQALLEMRENKNYKGTPNDVKVTAENMLTQLESIQKSNASVSPIALSLEPHIRALQQVLVNAKQ